MSTPAFSHQFSQRWIATPAPAKAVILQELEDIATLLHPDTDLATFTFSTPHLHEKIDALVQTENDRLERLYAEESEKARLKAEQEEHNIEALRQEKIQLEQQRLAREQEANADAQAQKLEKDTAEPLNPTTNKHQVKQLVTADIIQQMEDYIQLSLQETAEKLRAELRPWLEAEVEKQLTERQVHEPNYS